MNFDILKLSLIIKKPQHEAPGNDYRVCGV